MPAAADYASDPTLGASEGVVVSPDGSRAIQIVKSSDGATTKALLIDTATGAQVGRAIALPGSSNTPTVIFNDSGSRAVMTVQTFDPGPTTYVTLIDTTTGRQVGNTIVNTGSPVVGTTFTPAGDRLVVSDIEFPAGNPAAAQSHVVVLDALTGEQLGTTADFAGGATDHVAFSPDGKRAYLTVVTFGDPASENTRVVVINTDTGAKVGDFAPAQGTPASGDAILSSDGTRLFLVTNVDQGTTTRLTIIDAATGQTVGDPIDRVGGPGNQFQLAADDTRGILVSYEDAGSQSTTHVTVVNTATSETVGGPITMSGSPFYGVVVSPDGSQFVVTTINADGAHPSSVAIYDAVSGQQVGDTYGFDVMPTDLPVFSPDGSRLVIVGYNDPAGTPVIILDTATSDVVGGQPVHIDGASPYPIFRSGRAFFTASSAGTTRVVAVDLDDATTIESETFDGTATEGLVGAPDGDLVFQTVYRYDDATSSYVTRLVVIDISADVPTVAGGLYLPGSPSGGVTLTPDRTRALLTDNTFGAFPATTVTVIDTSAYIDNPNTTPIATGAPSVGSPVGLSSAVSGRVHFADPDGDALNYSASNGAEGHGRHRPCDGALHLHPFGAGEQ